MNRRKLMCLSIAMSVGLAAGTATAAEIRIVNQDAGTKKGLDDPTPTSPVGSNPGTTRGQQALIVFQFAADLWGAVLKSNVPIINNATFKDLSCTATSGVLGSSGTTTIHRFGSPPPAGALAGVWYHSALADALGGEDLGGGKADIQSQFNGKMGSAGCLEGSSWYFGLDGKTPGNQTNFLNVVLHEMAHGLGFSAFNSLATGKQFAGNDGVGYPDIYSKFVYDNTQGKYFYELTEQQRIASALNDNNLVFTGNHVVQQAPIALEATPMLRITAPAAVAGDYEFAPAAFGPKADASNFAAGVVRAVSGANLNDGCAALTNAAAVAGKIALIDRGTCDFATKSLNAQAAGAKAVLLANNQPGTLNPGGTPTSPVTIPVGLISQADGAKLKGALSGLTANGVVGGSVLAGADGAGRVKLYAPTTLAQGSSFSHYDTRLTPNALMEYAITDTLVGQIDVDLTPALFQDIGWQINDGTQHLLSCNTGVPTWVPGGVIVGANVLGSAKVIAGAAANLGGYRTAMLAYASDLAAGGLITQTQASSLNACLSDAELQKQFTAWGSGGTDPGGPVVVTLQNGVALGGQTGAVGGGSIYKLDVPAGARSLVLRTFGGTGDVSLYVKAGGVPTTTDYDAQSVHVGNAESVTVARPVAGTYYLRLVGVKAYAGVSVQGSYTAP